MAGTSYTRQSTLTDGSLITAALFNDEYNQLVNAFAYSATGTTGHTHDGSAGQGGAITKIGDQDFKNKIEISATNNRIECYVEVSGSAVEQIRIQDGAIVPVTDNDVDLGSSSVQFKDLYINGTGNIDSLVLGSGATVTAILDEDNMSSDSATALVTQQSIKAYVDSQVTAQDLDLTDGTTSISIDLDSEALSVLGGTGITSTASGNGVTLAIDSTVTTLTGTQTLTNKTLTSPDINGGSIDGAVIGASTAAAGSFTSVSATGDITVGGTVDGRDVAADGTKLDGIEAAATADQTAAEIRTLVESATDSNVFTDADHSKLNAIEANATADQTDAEIRAAVEAATDSNVFTDADHSKLNAIESGATADQTAAEIKTAYESNSDTNAFTDADHTKLDGIEASATADQTDAEIRAAVEAATDSNVFTDADHSKLNAIEASADVTDTANVTAAGAVMDSELTSEASVKALNQGVATTDSPSFVNLTLSGTGSVKVPSGTTAQRDGSPVNGMFRYNSTNEQFEGYQGGDWGAIGGGGGSNTFTADTFTGDGSTTAYALSQVINSEDNLLVFIDGVFQQQSAYSIATASGTTTLTFSTAPANTREIIVYSVASAVSGSNLNIDSMTGDGSDTTLSLTIAPVNENNTQVFIDGVYQNKDTYSISGTTLTFSTAPPTGSAVEVMTMTQTEVNVPVDGTITPAKIASGDFYFDTNTLYVDATNNRVGIGTSSPAYSLDIRGEAGLELYNASGGGDVLNLRPSLGDANKYNMSISSYDHSGGGVGPADGISINAFDGVSVATGSSTARQERMRIDSSGLIKAVSSITSDPTDTGAYWYNKSGVGPTLSGYRFSIRTGGTPSESFRIDESGNVGIGTTSPSSELTVGADTPQIDFLKTSSADVLANVRAETDAGSGGKLVFQTKRNGNTALDRMIIDDDGNVGIGTSSPSEKLQVEGTVSATGMKIGANGTDINSTFLGVSSLMTFKCNGTERMRIDSSGRLLVGKTSATATGFGTELRGSQIIIGKTSSGTVNGIYFNHNSSYVGGLNYTNTATALATSSDQRLKENIADADDAGSKIDAIQVRKFDWKEDNSHQEYGFIAQELEQVFPYAVHTAQNEMQTKGVDYASLVPMMLKEIQSLRNRVAQLEE